MIDGKKEGTSLQIIYFVIIHCLFLIISVFLTFILGSKTVSFYLSKTFGTKVKTFKFIFICRYDIYI